jgi:AraC family transcriptional regulator
LISNILDDAFKEPHVYVAMCRDQSPVRKLREVRLGGSSVSASIVEWEALRPLAVDWFSQDVHYFDMSLTARPCTRGYFDPIFRDQETYGKIFLAPAGYRLHGEAAECRNRSLSVFVRAHSAFADECELTDADEATLRSCLSLDGESVRDALVRIGREVTAPGFASEMLLDGLGLVLMAECARLLKSTRERPPRTGGLAPWRLKVIEDRIRCSDALPTHAELAQLCGLSRRHLARAFRHETGKTVAAFARDLKLQQAKALLVDGHEPIGTIATRAGFQTAAAFTTAFSRATGETPREYRASRRAGRGLPVQPLRCASAVASDRPDGVRRRR